MGLSWDDIKDFGESALGTAGNIMTLGLGDNLVDWVGDELKGKPAEESSEVRDVYSSVPIKVRMPSGAVITLYQNKKVGTTSSGMSSAGTAGFGLRDLLNLAGDTAAAAAYAKKKV